MPLPLLIPLIWGGASALASALGIGAGAKGVKDMSDAKKIGNISSENLNKAHEKVQRNIDKVKNELEVFGELKLNTFACIIRKTVDEIKRLKNTKTSGLIDTVVKSVTFTPKELEDLDDASLKAQEVIAGGVSSLGAGVLAGFGAYGTAISIGVASTGTAISALSGVAASNALLAWFGGGSLAAGGLGMAGGTAVLGAAIAGPVLAVGGFMLGSKGAKAKTAALNYSSEVDIRIAEIDEACEGLNALIKRIREGETLISNITGRLEGILVTVRAINYKKYRGLKYFFRWIFRKDVSPYLVDEDLKVLQNTVNLAKAIRQVIEVDLFDESGAMTEFSGIIFEKVKKELVL
jgi:hypothetical protein